MKDTGYKIYIMRAGDAPDNCEFYRMTDSYTLVYADGASSRSAELTEEELSLLSADDREWLVASMAQVYARYLKEHEKEFAAIMGERMTAFENELKKLAEEQEKGEENADDNENKG